MYKGEDLIDFPCAPIWAKHYADRGMTQDYPPEFYYAPQPAQEEPREPEPQWTQRQWDTVGQLRGQVKYLENKFNEHLDKSKKGKGDYV